MKQKSTEEIVQTLKQVYHGGFGLKEESGNISAWYAEDGIHLAKGASAIDSPRAQIIPWEDAASRIGELLEQGKFATNVELEEAVGYERMGEHSLSGIFTMTFRMKQEIRASSLLSLIFRGMVSKRNRVAC